MAIELGAAYVTVIPEMQGAQRTIGEALGDSSIGKKAGDSLGASMGDGIKGGLTAAKVAVGNILANMAQTAANAVAGSIDAAVRRVDTFNSFQTVMVALGESAGDAQAAVNAVKKGLDGLPSTSQNIVALLQQVKATGLSLNDATDVTLALNNAMLAGGKGTGYAEAAMQHYANALAKGKFSLIQWQSLVQTAPAQMDQLAKSILGAEAGQHDLYEAMKNGTVTMGEFNEAVVRLNKEGGNGIASFYDQAKAATKGISTSLQNFKSRISQAVAQVVTVINGGDGGTRIADALDAVSSQFSRFGKMFAAIAGAVIPAAKPLADALWGVYEAALRVADAITRTITDIIPKMEAGFGRSASLGEWLWALFIQIGKALGFTSEQLVPMAGGLRDLGNAIQGVLDWARQLVSDVFQWMLAHGDIVAAALKAIVAALVGMRIVKSVTGFVSAFRGQLAKIQAIAPKLSAPLSKVGDAITRTGTVSRANTANVLKMGLALMEVAAAVAIAAVGIWVIVDAAIRLGNAGVGAGIAFAGIVGALAALAAVLSTAGPALTAGAVGMMAFGIAVLLASAGIALVVAALSLLAGQLPTIAQYGMASAAAIAAMAGSLLLLAAGALASAVALPLLAIGLVLFSAASLAADVALIGLSVTVGVLAAAVGLLGGSLLLVQGSLDGIVAKAQQAVTTLAGMQGSVDLLHAGLDALGSKVSAIFDGFSNAVRGAMDTSRSAVEGFVSSSLAAFESGRQRVFDAGRMIASGFAEGMESMAWRVSQAADRLVSQAQRAVEAKARIQSPSKLFEDIGELIPMGLAVGIEGGTPAVSRAADSMVAGALSGARLSLAADLSGSPQPSAGIHIENMTVKADDAQSFVDQLVGMAGRSRSQYGR